MENLVPHLDSAIPSWIGIIINIRYNLKFISWPLALKHFVIPDNQCKWVLWLCAAEPWFLHCKKLEDIWLSWLASVKWLGSSPLNFTHWAKYARMLLLHDAILIFRWDGSKVAAIYIFVNKLPCRISMGKSRCYFIWKMAILSVPELVYITLASSGWDLCGERSDEYVGQILIYWAHLRP